MSLRSRGCSDIPNDRRLEASRSSLGDRGQAGATKPAARLYVVALKDLTVRKTKILALLAIGLGSGCTQSLGGRSPAQVCASADTLKRISAAVFQQAVEASSSQNRYALGRLGETAQPKLVDPLVENYDRDTRRTTCTATYQVQLPPGVHSRYPIDGPIRYTSQPTADGANVVFQTSGTEVMASRLAAADLGAWAETNARQRPGLVIEVASGNEPTSLPTKATQLADSRPNPVSRLPTAIPTGPPQQQRQAVASQLPFAPPRPLSRTLPVAAPSRTLPPPVQTDPAPELQRGGPVRVFVHIGDPGQGPAADQVRAELSTLSIAGQPIATPPFRLVQSLPRGNEVRCLKHADCPAASGVARHLARTLGVPVAVVDMSGTYEQDRAVRPGSLELWLRPGT